MYRECNSFREMGRRLVFLMYVVSATAAIILLVAGVASSDWTRMARGAAVFLIMAGLRQAGWRWFDFGRMYDSFPAGCARDIVPEPVRLEVEHLVREFHAGGTGWVRRGEIRRRLIELEELSPEIIDAYGADLQEVLAA